MLPRWCIWLRSQWYLFTNSAVTDVIGSGLTFVSGGGYTGADHIPGYWALAHRDGRSQHFPTRPRHVYDITGDRPHQIATVPIGSQIYWVTFTPGGQICYVAARGANAVAAVDTATKQIIARIPAGKEPKRLLVVTLPTKQN